MNPNETPEERLKRLEAEIQRLKAEVAHEEPAEGSSPPSPAPPVEENPEEAENLVRQAKLSEIRGNKREALDLLRKAASLAPNTPSVLTALGEGLLAAGLTKQALEPLKKAKGLEPQNAQTERLYAKAVLAATQDPLMALSGASSKPGADYASAKAAGMLNLFVPGLGQIVLGQTTKGLTYLVGWLACLVVAFLIPNGISGLPGLLSFKTTNVNLLVLLPLGVAFVFWLASIYDVRGQAQQGPKKNVSRPKPPVDLPFE